MRRHTYTHKILVEKPEERRPLGQPTLKWDDNIKVDFKNVTCGAVNWIHLPQYRGRGWALSNTVRKFRVPINAVKLFTRGGTVRFSRRAPLCTSLFVSLVWSKNFKRIIRNEGVLNEG